MKKIAFILILPLLILSCNNSKKEVKRNTIQQRLDSLVIENAVPGINFSIIYKDGKQENYSAIKYQTEIFK